MIHKTPIFFKLFCIFLLFAFISCSKDDDGHTATKNSYDIEFTRESGSTSLRTTYRGSDNDAHNIGKFDRNSGLNGALMLDFNHDGTILKGAFLMDADNNPLDLDYSAYLLDSGSLFELRDPATTRVYKGISGSVTIRNMVVDNSSESVRSATYIVEFNGEFELTEGDEITHWEGTAKIEVGQPAN